MKRNKLWQRAVLFAGVFVCLLAGAVCYGKTVRHTYVDDTKFDRYLQNKNLRVLYYHYPFDEQYDVYGEGETPVDYKALTDSADLIVKAKLAENGTRSIYQECVLSQIEVIDVYKGQIKGNRRLSIFEPVNCTGIEGEMLCSEGYLPMKDDSEYILFLKGLKNALFGEGDSVYIPSTLTYSKYEVGKTTPQKVGAQQAESGKLRYEDMKTQEVLLYSDKMYKKFLQFREIIFQKEVY